jgi:hypothetical protein
MNTQSHPLRPKPRHASLPARIVPGLLGAAALALLAMGCSDDHGGPTGSSVPASIASRGQLEFACGINCSYEGEAINQGIGCARQVRGVTRLLRPDGSELDRESWSLDPGLTIRAHEAFVYEGCCFSLGDVSAMGSYETDLSWNDVPCP